MVYVPAIPVAFALHRRPLSGVMPGRRRAQSLQQGPHVDIGALLGVSESIRQMPSSVTDTRGNREDGLLNSGPESAKDLYVFYRPRENGVCVYTYIICIHIPKCIQHMYCRRCNVNMKNK